MSVLEIVVGAKVKLRNGDLGTIVGFDEETGTSVKIKHDKDPLNSIYWYAVRGDVWLYGGSDNQYDVVEVLEKDYE